MSLLTIQNDEEVFDQQFFGDKDSQPLIKVSQAAVIVKEHKSKFKHRFGKKLFSNLLLFGGGLLLFQGSINLFHLIVRSGFLLPYSFTLRTLAYTGIGLILTTLGIKEPKNTRHYLSLLTFPLMGCAFDLLYKIAPREWYEGDTLFALRFTFFLLTLVVFYYVKEHFISKNYVETTHD